MPPTEHLWNLAVEKLVQKGGEKMKKFIKDLPRDKWAVAFAPEVHRYGELTSNAAESFNSWILQARALPVTFMLDFIRMQMMRWFNERRAECAKWTGLLTPVMEKKWNTAAALGLGWTVLPTNNHGIYEVLCLETVVVQS